jgi:hypothetical protein
MSQNRTFLKSSDILIVDNLSYVKLNIRADTDSPTASHTPALNR